LDVVNRKIAVMRSQESRRSAYSGGVEIRPYGVTMPSLRQGGIS